MIAEDKAKTTAQKITGMVRKHLSKATGDEPLEADGRSDQAKGDLKNAGEKPKTPSRSS
jgi:uncharacterized protein YjbJ (UPF0337 family)